MLRVVALDPGGTTGWATYSADVDWDVEHEMFVHRNPKWQSGQIGPNAHHLALWSFLGMMHTGDTRIICERFEYRNTSRAGLVLDSKEYIGVVNLFAQDRSATLRRPVAYQNASEAKGFVRDSHIKKLGLWSSGNPHAMDATRHLLYWLTNKYEDTDFRLELLRLGWK